MQGKMNYRTKRNIIIVAVLLVLFLIASVSTYVFIKANNDTQAVSKLNSESENRNSGEQEVAKEQKNDVANNEENVVTTDESVEQTQEVITNNRENTVVVADNNNVTTNNEEETSQTQRIETTETYETTNTIVGFAPADINLGLSNISANLTNLQNNIKSVTLTGNSYVIVGGEITYNIEIKNSHTGTLKQIDISAIIPEGTELVEGTISDNGTVENGKISWEVDIDTEKTVSFTVKVTKTEGNIEAVAIVNGKTTNMVTNVIDEAPILTVINPNRYEMEVGTEYQEKGYSAIDKVDGDITDKVVLTYRFLPIGSSNWTDLEEMDTNKLGTYRINYTVTDSAGNTVTGSRVVQIVDTQAPEIIVKEGYVGNIDRNVFSNVSFKLHDNYGVSAYKINDGEYTELTVNKWSDANFENIKSKLVYGKNTITLKDVTGNETTYEFVYDNVAPTIKVKDGYVGNVDRNIFSKVSFSLYDEYGVVAYKINDGEYGEFAINKWSDANFENIKSRLVYGKNTITLKDVAGNETTYEFVYDNVAPTIKVKDGYVGNLDRNIFSKVSFSLYDEYGVVAYKINDGEYGEFAINKWSDANFENIKSRLVYGKNTITLKDVAGNETTYEFVYDNVAPTIKVKDGYVGNIDRNIFSKVSFSLYDEYGVVAYKINDGEYVEFAINKWSDANFENIKSRLVYGKNTITLKDVAGNETTYEFVYDNVAPTIKVKDGYVGNLDRNIFSKVSFSLYDEYGVVSYKINDGEYVEFAINKWSDANFENIKSRLVYGKNTITLKDVAGNETTYEFVYDNVAPTIKVKDGYVGNLDRNIFSKVSFSLYDEYGVVAYKINDGEYVEFAINKWSDANFENIKSRLVYGKNTITLKDVAGNETTYEFTYDNIAPEVDKIQLINLDNTNSSYIKNKETVRFNVTFKEEISTLPVLTIGNQTAEFKQISGGNGEVIYQADLTIDVAKNIELKEGILEFTISGYKDIAGNEGVSLNETNARNSLTFDKTKPVVTGAENGKYYNTDITLSIEDANPGTIHLHKDGELVKPYNPEKPITEEGRYTAYASDLAGNKSETIEFVIDKTKPVVTGAENGKYYNTDITLNIEDANPGTIHLHKDGKLVKNYKPGTPITEEGRYTVYASDLAGNKSKTIEFVIDKTKPALLGVENGTITRQDVTLTIEDANPGTIHLHKDGKLVKNYKPGTPITEEGNYSAYVSDLAGNKSKTIEFIIDKTMPKVEGVEDGKYYNHPVTVTIIEEHLQNAKVQVNNGKWEEFTSGTTFSEDGTYFIRVTDKAYNEKAELTFTIDQIAPTATVTFSNDNGNAMTNKDITVTLVASETIKDIKEEGWTRVDDKTFTKVYSENGKYSVEIEDLAGNISKINYEVKRLDKEAPTATVTFSNDNGNAMTNKDVTVTLVASESIKDIKEEGWTRVNDKTFTKVYSENGKYFVEITDKAGNTSTIKFEVKRIDKVAPIITLPKENTFEVGVDVYTYPEAGTVWDEFDKEISFGKVNMEWFKANADGSKGEKVENFEWNTTLTNRELGNYYIEYSVSDKAGNVATAHRVLTLQDTTAPTVTINGETEKKIAQGEEYTELGATVKDNYDTTPTLNTVIYYSETGKDGTYITVDKIDTSKLGVYAVWYSAQDAQGNKSEAVRRIVKVVDVTKPTVEVEYSTKEMARTVTVTLKASEPIIIDETTAGSWNSYDNNVYKKVHYYNGEYTVNFKDLSGNEGSVVISINNIDRKGPTAEISKVINDKEENRVDVTLVFDEKIDESTLGQGWYKVSGKENTYTKAYYNEKTCEFIVKDVLGNESTITFTTNI